MIKPLIKRQKGFTLVEILIVVSLIAILAVVALITINPAEAQRRARDTQRLKDVSSMQSIMEQYLSDNPTTASSTNVTSSANGGTNDCATGWIGINLCAYANTLPRDPVNRQTIVATTAVAGSTSAGAIYQLILNAEGQYRICSRMESKANVSKLTTDGAPNDYFEVYSYTGVAVCGS